MVNVITSGWWRAELTDFITEVHVQASFDAQPPALGQNFSHAFLASLDTQLGAMYDDVVRLWAPGQFPENRHGLDLPVTAFRGDKVGIRLEMFGQNRNFYKMVAVENDPFAALMNMIEQLIQSDDTLLFDLWHFTFQIIRIPFGFARRAPPFSISCQFGKTSVVTIRNHDDLCLWRAIVVCSAHWTYKTNASRQPHLRAQFRRDYKRIARPGSADQRVKAESLRDGCGPAQRPTYHAVGVLANYLRINITVLEASAPKWVAFRSAQSGVQYGRTFYVLKTGEHFDAVTSITGFFAHSYYCESCCVAFNTKSHHKCSRTPWCLLCLRPPSAHVEPLPESIFCDNCSRTFRDRECHEIHTHAICIKSWRYVCL